MTYIPRSSLTPTSTGAIPRLVQKRRTIHIFALLGTVLLIGMTAVAVGMFFYSKYLDRALVNADRELTASFDVGIKEKTDTLASYSRKLMHAEQLLNAHLSPSRMLTLIERMTKQTVQLDGLEYEYDPGFEATLSLSGQTAELMSVAAQKDQIARERLFENFFVQGINIGAPPTEGDSRNPLEQLLGFLGVGFKVEAVLKMDELRYNSDFVYSNVMQQNTALLNTEVPSETLFMSEDALTEN